MHGTVAAVLGLVPLFAHGGVAGAVVELSAGLLIVAIALFSSAQTAIRTQYAMLALMVLYTCTGLWLLSSG